MGINTGGYLKRLSEVYDVIETHRPINAKPNGKLQKHLIKDNFLNFWFRFIYRHTSAIEAENIVYVKRVLDCDLSSFSCSDIGRLFQKLLANTMSLATIGSMAIKTKLILSL